MKRAFKVGDVWSRFKMVFKVYVQNLVSKRHAPPYAPGYPCYRNILEALGVEVVSIPVDATTNFQPTTELLDESLRGDPRPLKGLIVASPSNPTGTVLKTSELFALHAWCKARSVWFVSDEIYHQIEYGVERASTALESPVGLETVHEL